MSFDRAAWCREWRAKNRARVRAYERARYAANLERFREKTKAWRVKNGDKANALRRARRKKIGEFERKLERDRAKARYERDRKRALEKSRRDHAAAVANLSDGYIRLRLRRQGLQGHELTSAAINEKREQLAHKRGVWEARRLSERKPRRRRFTQKILDGGVDITNAAPINRP